MDQEKATGKRWIQSSLIIGAVDGVYIFLYALFALFSKETGSWTTSAAERILIASFICIGFLAAACVVQARGMKTGAKPQRMVCLLALAVTAAVLAAAAIFALSHESAALSRQLTALVAVPALPQVILSLWMLRRAHTGKTEKAERRAEEKDKKQALQQKFSCRPLWIVSIAMGVGSLLYGLVGWFSENPETWFNTSQKILPPMGIGVFVLLAACVISPKKPTKGISRGAAILIFFFGLVSSALVFSGYFFYLRGDAATCHLLIGCRLPTSLLQLILSIRALQKDPSPSIWEERADEILARQDPKAGQDETNRD